MEWSGRCLHKECQSLICDSCWVSENKRYCSGHFEEALGKEKEGKKKTFFKPEPLEAESPHTPVDLQEDEREKITVLTNSYIDFVKQRFSNLAPDWSAEGSIDNAKSQFKSSLEGFEITVSSKHFFSKKDKLKVIVKPVYGRKAEDLDFVLSTIKDEPHIYHLLVLIGNECDATALEFVDTFNKHNASLFLIEPSKHLIFMDEKPITKSYSPWLDSTKPPQTLRDILRTLVTEKVSGRDTITTKALSDSFGLSDQDAFIFLNSCKFLKFVEDTDTFYFVS